MEPAARLRSDRSGAMSKRRLVTRTGPRLLSVCALLLVACEDERGTSRIGAQQVIAGEPGTGRIGPASVEGESITLRGSVAGNGTRCAPGACSSAGF